MKAIRNCVYVAALALTALNFAPTLASAQEPVHGKFTLTHEVHWGAASLPAGDYAFSYTPDNGSRTLSITNSAEIAAATWCSCRIRRMPNLLIRAGSCS